MAGKIIADTLEHSTAGSVTTDYVVNGSAKAWINFTTVTTTSDLDSFNISTLTDNGGSGGDTTSSYTNAMSSNNYASVGLCGEQLTTAAARIMHIGTKTASAIRVHTTTTSAVDDMPENNIVVHGDLA